jgi:glycosyltransferase involved in cell wall biosynthesis
MVLEVNDYYDSVSIKNAKYIVTPNKRVLPQEVSYKTIEHQWGANIDIFRPGIDAGKLRDRYSLHNKRIAVIVCSGLPWHGLDDVIDSAEMVVENMPDVVFMIVGGGIDPLGYKDKINSLKLANVIIFTGPVKYSEVPEYISLADVALAPYNSLLKSLLKKGCRLREFSASPLKVFEYMACGKPVIVTEVANKNNIITHMETGIVISEDSPCEIAEAILSLLKNYELRDRLGKNARIEVENRFSWDKHVNELEKILKKETM